MRYQAKPVKVTALRITEVLHFRDGSVLTLSDGSRRPFTVELFGNPVPECGDYFVTPDSGQDYILPPVLFHLNFEAHSLTVAEANDFIQRLVHPTVPEIRLLSPWPYRILIGWAIRACEPSIKAGDPTVWNEFCRAKAVLDAYYLTWRHPEMP